MRAADNAYPVRVWRIYRDLMDDTAASKHHGYNSISSSLFAISPGSLDGMQKLLSTSIGTCLPSNMSGTRVPSSVINDY